MPESSPLSLPRIDGVTIRQATAGDLSFLYSTFLRDLRDADPSGLPDALWFPPHRAYLDAVLSDRRTTTLIAAADDRPSEILGYVIANPEELIWILVRKGPLREKGIAKLLLASAGVAPTLPSRWATRLSRARLPNPCRSRQLRRAVPSTGGPVTPSTR